VTLGPRVAGIAPATRWPLTAALAGPVFWIPGPGPEYQRIFGELIQSYAPSGNLIPDAALAALAIGHGVTLISTDTDFARFRALRWENPLSRPQLTRTPERLPRIEARRVQVPRS
jgi:hypothetical protein